ncbi:mannose-6-phosphate isomerase, class I [Salinibacterium sp. G-O1]|uniref:mannose-6-phosphate isomerase, class I n=1 Tax=Salinibacterium sp. G-O1 TaxID=3046208 RepID=UPI0024B9CE85|nr:mannose-6-phosphate isomerase, class I [Salinibacterium sp. G-O1]MDJ0336536.1 mannose-6-phosphate isomerase, class I [Salinibacterium sp. G-O1]
MFVGITNTPRDYAWGSDGAISALLGFEASGAPEAELWLGAHSGSPSRVVDSTETLLDVVDGRLPFLLKVLAAGSPLSLQAHPTMAQAAEGFARENALGIPLDAPNRNYKDAFHKPELIYALSDEFDALCGFRSAADIRAALEAGLPAAAAPMLDRLTGDESLRDVFEWLITRGEGVDALVAAISAAADESTPELATVRMLAENYPGDPGIVISLMLNRVTLARGEALFLPAGNIHAYLSGLGIELMASSDNVLRGGLTPKYIDVPELLGVLDFRPLPVPYLAPQHPSGAVDEFRPADVEFALLVIGGDANVPLDGPAIALCLDGEFMLAGSESQSRLSRGSAVYISDEERLDIQGSGSLVLATT